MRNYLRHVLILCFAFSGIVNSFAQEKFDESKLDSPAKNGAEIAALLKTIEVLEYEKDTARCVFLTNGFRSAEFINANDWLSISDTVHAVRVDIVYSKYPLRKGVYKEIYPLLFNRLKSTFSMDPSLNSTEIQWNKILQTHCENDKQVNELFHGVVIWYEVDEMTPISAPPVTKLEKINTAQTQLVSEQMTFDQINANVDYMSKSPLLTDSVQQLLKKADLDDKIEILQSHYQKIIDDSPTVKFEDLDERELDKYKNEMERFLNMYNGDPVVMKVLDRHPEWKNILVVNDWTGSMYSYGAQVLKWHILNHEKSGIQSITLFNDGDNKQQKNKVVGETEGIYFEEADNIPQLIALFQLVMTKGGGGDGPENDIEAILTTIEEYPRFSEIVLIADNNACVRDIALADRIDVPVRVILCGYAKNRGIHPDYVYLAKKTGGGIYTIDQDIENLEAELGEKGEVKSLDMDGLKMSVRNCGSTYSGYSDGKGIKEVVDFEKSRFKKRKVRRIDASDRELTTVPSWISRVRKLEEINLSENKLEKLPASIAVHGYLRSLDVSKNKLTKVPQQFKNLKFLVELNLSNNEFQEFPDEIRGMTYLKKLDLSHNKLLKFQSIKAKGLEELNLSFNELTRLGTGLRRYVKLHTVDLSNNELVVFPEFLPNSGHLKFMNLANNQIEKLPDNLVALFSLTELNLTGNPLPAEEVERIQRTLVHTKVLF